MDKEFVTSAVATFIKVLLKNTKETDMGNSDGKMGTSILDILKKITFMERAYSTSITEINMMVCSQMTILTGRAHIYLPMGIEVKVSGNGT